MTNTPNIVLTNDDGIDSPGLWAIADALSDLGNLWITAPSTQQTGAGRCFFRHTDGIIVEREPQINNKGIRSFAINCSPAQTVFHAVKEILPCKPDLVVSGINYGENLGNIVLSSGTIGATMEAASWGIPAIAVSQEIKIENTESYLEYSNQDFSGSAYFGAKFAAVVLSKGMLPNMDIIKIDVPIDATKDTPWRIARVSRVSEMGIKLLPRSFDEPATLIWGPYFDREKIEPDSDIHAVCVERVVSVSPLTIDMTANVNFSELKDFLE